jgi:transposase
MAKPYSIELRERVVTAVEKGGPSRREAASWFGVGISTAITWVRRFRRTGSVAPGQAPTRSRMLVACLVHDLIQVHAQLFQHRD